MHRQLWLAVISFTQSDVKDNSWRMNLWTKGITCRDSYSSCERCKTWVEASSIKELPLDLRQKVDELSRVDQN